MILYYIIVNISYLLPMEIPLLLLYSQSATNRNTIIIVNLPSCYQ